MITFANKILFLMALRPKVNYELNIQMRRDLFAAYRDVTTKPCPSQRIAWIRTVKHPAPRYYVTLDRAHTIMCALARHDYKYVEELKRPYRRRMFLDLFEEVKRLSEKREFQGKSIKYITSFALLQPAKEFYIGWESFKKIFRNCKRYGADFMWRDAVEKNKAYTNRKDNKGIDKIYKGDIYIIK